MSFRLRIDRLAQREIDEFAIYEAAYSEQFAAEQIARLNEILSADLSVDPLRSTFFALTGAPYRALLFRVGSRTNYWIIYTVDEPEGIVKVLRFWNSSRGAGTLDL